MSGAEEGALLRVPPHSEEAEQSLLGALLIDNGALDRLPPLTEADFYTWEGRSIFAAMAELIAAGRPADVITVNDQLRKRLGDQADAIGLDYLNALATSVPSSSNAPAYAHIVADVATRRRVIALLGEIQSQAYAAQARDGAEALIDKAVTELMALQEGRRRDEPADLGALAATFIDELQARADGHTDAFSTGLRDLDRLTSEGGRRGELWVIGARPSMGKTAFSLSLSRAVGVGHQVLMLTQEDSLGMLTARHVAAAGRVNLAHIRNPRTAPNSMWQGVTDGVTELVPLRIAMDDQAGLSLADVRRKVQQVKRRHGDCALVVVDYLQLMEGQGGRDERRHDVVSDISRGLKNLAKELGAPVCALSQLNRKVEERPNKRPVMSDLRESGAIEQDADVIAFLYREDYYNPETAAPGVSEFILGKNRHGPVGTAYLTHDLPCSRFRHYEGRPRYTAPKEPTKPRKTKGYAGPELPDGDAP